MKYKIISAFMCMNLLSAPVMAKKDPQSSSQKSSKPDEAKAEVNLPGVKKITQNYDQKFVQEFSQHQAQASQLSQKVNSFNEELISKCKDQEELSSECKEVFIKQTEAQIEMFQSFFKLYSEALKLMQLKKEAIESSGSSLGFIKKIFN